MQDVAIEVFEHGGSAETSIETIARRAAVSVGAVYLHFKSKEDLYVSLVPAALQRLTEAITCVPAEPATVFKATWLAMWRWAARERAWAQALVFLSRPELRGQLAEETIRLVNEAIAATQRRLQAQVQCAIAGATPPRAYPSDALTVTALVWALFLGGLTLDTTADVLQQPHPLLDAISIIDADLRRR